MEQKLLTIDEVREKLFVSKSCIYNYVAQRRIPYLKLGGKLLFAESDLDEWINFKKTKCFSPDWNGRYHDIH